MDHVAQARRSHRDLPPRSPARVRRMLRRGWVQDVHRHQAHSVLAESSRRMRGRGSRGSRFRSRSGPRLGPDLALGRPWPPSTRLSAWPKSCR